MSGASSGTLTFTTANAHTGSWSVTSATSGLAEAQMMLPSTGGAIAIPAGQYTMYGPFCKLPMAVYLQGAGEDATTFVVDASFPMSALGVFAIPDDTPVYDTDDVRSGGLSGFTVSFTQPDSTDITTYTQWPPAIYGLHTSRLLIEHVKALRAWNFIVLNGYNGPNIYDCKSSFFNHGIDLYQMVNSSRINSFEATSFGLTPNQETVMFYNAGTYAFYLGKVDDISVLRGSADCNFAFLYSGTQALGGYPWATFVACDMDAGGFIMLGGRVCVAAGCTIGGSTLTGVLSARYPVKYSGGELNITDCWIGYENSNSAPLIDVDFSSGPNTDYSVCRVNLTNNRFFLGGGQFNVLVNVHTTGSDTGTVTMIGNRILYPPALGSSVPYPVVRAIGPVKVVAVGNAFDDKYAGAGTIFEADTDYEHVFSGNSAPGWNISPPSFNASCVFRDNTGLTNPLVLGADVASGNPLVPSGRYFRVTGTETFLTIETTLVVGVTVVSINEITIIPAGAFKWGTGGNIAVAGTAVVGVALTFVYDNNTSLWHPSYT